MLLVFIAKMKMVNGLLKNLNSYLNNPKKFSSLDFTE